MCDVWLFLFLKKTSIHYTNIQHVSINNSTSISYKNNKICNKAFNWSLFFFFFKFPLNVFLNSWFLWPLNRRKILFIHTPGFGKYLCTVAGDLSQNIQGIALETVWPFLNLTFRKIIQSSDPWYEKGWRKMKIKVRFGKANTDNEALIWPWTSNMLHTWESWGVTYRYVMRL